MSVSIVVAEGTLLDEIHELTYPTWNEGLSRRAYAQWNGAQLRTSWGRDRLHRVALRDSSGRLLATAKRYRFDARLSGADVRMVGFGAVFTPPELRGRGYASALLDRLMTTEREEGAALAVLFSEIGSEYYARLGFTVVPLDEVTVDVVQKPGTPAMLVRAGSDADYAAIAAIHNVSAAPAMFSVVHDVERVHFGLARKRLQAGLGREGHRQTEFFVAEEGASAVAYVIITATEAGWTLEEAGDRDPAGARLGAMLQVLLAREPSRPAPLIRAWWPRGQAVPPQVRLVDIGPSRDLLMVRPLSGAPMPQAAEDVFFWRGDYF